MKKSRISTRREKIAVVNNFIDVLKDRQSFLITGHENPDEDCVASMVAYCLLLAKFNKPPTMVFNKENWEKFPYLLNICKYNSIKIIGHPDAVTGDYDTIMVFDTPKPSMMEFKNKLRPLLDSTDTVVMEIDHHLEADGEYIGDAPYRFVDEASSTCELIGYFALKLSKKKNLIKAYHIDELFTRNFVLALVTGMVSDSKMGQFLKTPKEKRLYRYFSKLFNRMLIKKTDKNSGNFSSVQDIFDELEKLSTDEDFCCRAFSSYKQSQKMISWIAMDEKAITPLFKDYDLEAVITAARYSANVLAEESGHLSLVAYYDHPDNSDFVQFRMRRSQNYSKFDLRKVTERFSITNGGGHAGAVGFRVPKDEIKDLNSYIEMLISGTVELIDAQ